jgi:ammonia channel protein AmtB
LNLFCLGGILGAFMTGLFCEQSVNEFGGNDGAFYGRPIQLWYQTAGILTAIGKYIISN